jgi:hypothetical protein
MGGGTACRFRTGRCEEWMIASGYRERPGPFMPDSTLLIRETRLKEYM